MNDYNTDRDNQSATPSGAVNIDTLILPPIIAILVVLCIFYTIEYVALLDRTEKMENAVAELRKVQPQAQSEYDKIVAQFREVGNAVEGIGRDLILMSQDSPEARKVVLDMQIRDASAGTPQAANGTNAAPRPPAPAVPPATNSTPRPR